MLLESGLQVVLKDTIGSHLLWLLKYPLNCSFYLEKFFYTSCAKQWLNITDNKRNNAKMWDNSMDKIQYSVSITLSVTFVSPTIRFYFFNVFLRLNNWMNFFNFVNFVNFLFFLGGVGVPKFRTKSQKSKPDQNRSKLIKIGPVQHPISVYKFFKSKKRVRSHEFDQTQLK